MPPCTACVVVLGADWGLPNSMRHHPCDGLQVGMWRPAELLNGRVALLGLAVGLVGEGRSGHALTQQAMDDPLLLVAPLLAVVLLTATARQLKPRLCKHGLLWSSELQLWLGRVAMLAFVCAVVQESSDPAHRPVLTQLHDAILGPPTFGPRPASEVQLGDLAAAVGVQRIWEWLLLFW